MAKPQIYNAQGIVLKQAPIGEADRIITLYTLDMGKVRAVARGVRKTRSKLGGYLEPLTHVLVSVTSGKTLDVISGVEMLHSFRVIKEDLELVATAVYMTELVQNISEEHSANPDVFELLFNGLVWLQETKNPILLIRIFEVYLLKHSGFAPELYHCVECGLDLEPGDYAYNCAKGGLLCSKCQFLSTDVSFHISLNAIKVMRYLQREPYGKASALRVGSVIMDEIENVLQRYVQYILERRLKSADFMDLVRIDTCK